MGFPLTEGVWFLCQIINPDDPNEKAYVMSLSGLTGDVEIVHKLNEKFLPDISYTKLVDKPEFPDVPEDVVRYDTEQDLYSRQRKIARENIDAASGSETSESLDNIHAALVTGHLSKDLSFFPLDSIEKLNSAWIMSIEKETFKNNDTLTSVNLPNVTSIEDQTFYMCSKLATINMPNVEHIGYRGLAFCCLLTDIKFPNLTSMGEHCFVGNDGLVLVNDNMLPKITYISANAFNNCSNLITVDLSNVTSLDGGAFMDCEALTSVNLPNVTTFESGHQFCDCYALTEVNLPKVVSLGTLGAFNDCSSLIAIDLPNTIEVSNESFRGCEALTNVNLPNAITIGDRAFGECLSLRKLDLPKAASIGEQCFFGGVQLEALILRNTESMCTAKGDICASYSSWGTGSILHIYVPRALIEDYKVAENWSQYASKFRALEDYTVDGTITGELDETKIQ